MPESIPIGFSDVPMLSRENEKESVAYLKLLIKVSGGDQKAGKLIEKANKDTGIHWRKNLRKSISSRTKM